MKVSQLILTSVIVFSMLTVQLVPAYGAAVIAQVDIGFSNQAVMAINTVTNRLYVTNSLDGTVSVMNTLNNQIVATINVGLTPSGVAVNDVTDRIYVANQDSETISVINGLTNTVIATLGNIPVPNEIAVNPVTNRIYVTNNLAGTIQVINGIDNTMIATIIVGGEPFDVEVNTVTDRIYVSIPNIGVAVINGLTNNVIETLISPDFPSPLGIGINPITERIYVSNFQVIDNFVTVINSVTNNVITTIPFPANSRPYFVGVDIDRNKIFVTTTIGNKLHVINGLNNTVEEVVTHNVVLPSSAIGLAVHTVANRVYFSVAENESNQARVMVVRINAQGA